MVAEKGEAVHTRYTPKPMPAGSVPEEGAPKVRVPVKADTDQFGREELEKLRTPEGPAPLIAHEGTEKPSEKPTDPRLGETNVVRRNNKHTPEEQATARKEADAIFAAHVPGSAEFMRGVQLCLRYDLKLPVVDLDDIQAFADAGVRDALTEARKSPASLRAPERDEDDEAAVLAPTPRFSRKHIAVALAALLLLLPAVIYLGVRLGTPDAPGTPVAVGVPTLSPTALELVTNTVAPLPTAVPSPTADVGEAAPPRPSVTATASTNVSPPQATARPTVSPSTTASSNTAAPAPSSSLAKPVW